MHINNVPQIKGLNFGSLIIRNAIRNQTFTLLTIFTGPICNLNCPYCFTSKWEKRNPLMGINDFVNLFTEAKKIGAEAVWWVGQGEPFLVPFWKDLIHISKENNLWIGVFTNGTQISDTNARFILEHDVSIYMKLNSFNPKIQGQLIGRDGNEFLKQVIPCIEWFVENRMAKQQRLAVESVITKLNYEEIPTLFRWCRDREIIPFIEMMEHACEGAKILDVSPEQHVKLFRELQRIDREEYGYEWDTIPPWAAYQCRNIYLGLAVDAWGNVTPCSGMRYYLGNIHEKSLMEIWESEEAKKLRDPNLCEPQPWDGRKLGCYGCKSHAYRETGNPFATDPRCGWFEDSSSFQPLVVK